MITMFVNPGSRRRGGRIKRDSSPASSGGGGRTGGGTKTSPAAAMITYSGGGVGGGSWSDDMPGGGSAGEGVDELDGAGSGGANESRSSGGGSGDWQGPFLVDGTTTSLDIEKRRLINKIEHVKEKLVAANKTKEAEVDEFLRLTSNAPVTGDNPQMIRIRQVFEKKNKKSAHTIMTLQKKLDAYQQKLRDLEIGATGSGATSATSGGGGSGGATMTAGRRQKSENVLTNVGQGLKDVGANIKGSLTGYTGGVFENIKEGLSGLSSVSQSAAGTVISVPKDLAHKLLKKSDSADNIHNSNQSIHNTTTTALITAPPGTISSNVLVTSGGGSPRGPSETTTVIAKGAEGGMLPNSLGRLEDGRRIGSSLRNVHAAAPSAVFYTDPERERRDRGKDEPGSSSSRLSHRSVSPPSNVPQAGGGRRSADNHHHQQQQQIQDTPRRFPHAQQLAAITAQQLLHASSSAPSSAAARYELQQQQQQAQYEQVLAEMQALRRSNDQMVGTLDELRSKIQQEYSYFHASIHELTFRVQRMEDHLNDQAELHSAEVNGIRGDLQTVEARVSYQMSQIDGDLKDVIGRVTTRVEALQHRVKDQFGVDQNAVGTLAIRAGYLLAQTFLTIVFLLTQGLLPFMKTRARSITTVVVIIIAIIFFRNLDVFEEWTLRFSRRA